MKAWFRDYYKCSLDDVVIESRGYEIGGDGPICGYYYHPMLFFARLRTREIKPREFMDLYRAGEVAENVVA